MELDFTHSKYISLCNAIIENGYQTLTVRDYIQAENHLGGNIAIIRHDVDRFPNHSLRIAKLEHELGLHSTYYFRYTSDVFKPEIIQDIAAMGHEIGFHYESLARTRGNYSKAINLFLKEISKFREICTIQTISMHGSPLSPYDNRNLWRKYDFHDFGLIGEVYLSIDYAKIIYLTDAGRTWAHSLHNLRDHVSENQLTDGVNSTNDLINMLQRKHFDRLCISAHPERWSKDVVELMSSSGLDLAARVIKLIIRKVRK